MPHRSSDASSRDNLNTFAQPEDRRRTGRYIAGGTALAFTLLGLHHLLLRGASTIAGVCVPAIIMASYIIWVLYSARRDRRKALRFATAMQLTEVITAPSKSTPDAICKDVKSDSDFRRNSSNSYKSQNNRENPAFSDKDEI
ncbi:PREDICTED: uncharacterized protein LOC105449428 [Wasmannia auropunctata]|uniref:uncharacterized protein LOC105449428 n=1 Tax=Wasmannia auropunctata TaxID=64793 RepID=UPI0005ED8A51|nr:PREDICTED: uncharacterized protein LOC105449428 [Wasmannia auropunctata]XP_011686961.1 PREDICTED: uncharacterized protein LOC105449428 [Wasmannia auropunctata]XP_011686963.1 PREDICTED: uncharacterized protein LOC105449428 [Wasmannia auropunctata]